MKMRPTAQITGRGEAPPPLAALTTTWLQPREISDDTPYGFSQIRLTRTPIRPLLRPPPQNNILLLSIEYSAVTTNYLVFASYYYFHYSCDTCINRLCAEYCCYAFVSSVVLHTTVLSIAKTGCRTTAHVPR